jgi:hypothetical protein
MTCSQKKKGNAVANSISSRIPLVTGGILLGLALLAVPSTGQTSKKLSQQVMNALATFPRVVLHTQILIDANNYARLPHENGEIKDGSEALKRSVAHEPQYFKVKIDSLLKRVDADSQGVADAADARDDAKLAQKHAALAASVKLLLAAFPASAQPPPPKPPKG